MQTTDAAALAREMLVDDEATMLLLRRAQAVVLEACGNAPDMLVATAFRHLADLQADRELARLHDSDGPPRDTESVVGWRH